MTYHYSGCPAAAQRDLCSSSPRQVNLPPCSLAALLVERSKICSVCLLVIKYEVSFCSGLEGFFFDELIFKRSGTPQFPGGRGGGVFIVYLFISTSKINRFTQIF